MARKTKKEIATEARAAALIRFQRAVQDRAVLQEQIRAGRAAPSAEATVSSLTVLIGIYRDEVMK